MAFRVIRLGFGGQWERISPKLAKNWDELLEDLNDPIRIARRKAWDGRGGWGTVSSHAQAFLDIKTKEKVLVYSKETYGYRLVETKLVKELEEDPLWTIKG